MKYLILLLLISGCTCKQPMQLRSVTTDRLSAVEIQLKMLADKVEALRPQVVKEVQ